MTIIRESVCGALQSNDCFVRLAPSSNGIELELKSPVMYEFGSQIEDVIRGALKELGVENCKITVEDKGALDCTIKARVETAVRRAV